MKRRILLYAPLNTNIPPEKKGGAEAGCQKTKTIYEKASIDVVTLSKPVLYRGRLWYFLEMLFTPLIFLIKVKREGKKVPVHIVGFYSKIVKFEWLLMRIAHFCGNKVIYEVRNGSMISSYNEGTPDYKDYLRCLLLQPEIVLCQGLEYVDFIKENWGVERSYYPNYIMDDYVRPNIINRSHPIKLIYFGRVTESKNVDVSIKALSVIREKGLDAKLEIIGGCGEQYKRKIEGIIQEKNLGEYVNLYGRKPFDYIASELRNSHYFIFPTTEKQEGHSNSLTEAMGFGVVPIASKIGFNASICGNDDLVVDSFNPIDYAERIIKIERANNWSYYSEFVYKRVLNNYTESIVGKKLIETIDGLYE